MPASGATSVAGTPGAVGLTLRSLSRVFGGSGGEPVEALRAVDLDLEPGSFTALIGPSGCGKTTILRILAGLDRATSGGYEFRGLATGESPRIGYCFQEPRLLPWRTVGANVSLPLEFAGVPKAERRMRAATAIGKVELAGFMKARPATLSGGMRMRAAVARAIVASPQLLLLDEPFGALDEVTRYRLDEVLRNLWMGERFTTLLVTHSIPEAVFLADRVLVLSPRPGRIIGEVSVDLPERTPEIRGSDRFAAHVRELYRMLLAAMGDLA
jgi:NitT/TauT family transport system ATP-binding protein